MNNVTVLHAQDVLGKSFQIYGTKEAPLFLAKEVAEWIEYTGRTGQLLNTVDEEEKLMHTIYASGQNREMWFLTEDGLYEVLMQSRKPIAKAFKKEVKTILKTIRQTGSYAPIDILSPEMQAVHSMILEMARQKQETLLAIEQTQQAVKEVGNEVQQVLRPVVESFSRKEHWRKASNRMINGMAERTGKEHRVLRHEIYNRLEERAKVRLGVRLNNLKMRLHREGVKPSVINALNVLDVIEQDVQLQHIFLQVIQELHLELCVA